MIVFKTFLKVLNKCKVPILIYTVMLIFFGGFNMQTSDTATSFTESKPDVYIVNLDVNEGITKNLVEYMEKHSNIIPLENDEEVINDAIFYRNINYMMYIPKDYRKDFLEGKNPTIEIKSTKDYQASLANMLLERYLKVANTYLEVANDEDKIIENINRTLEKEVEVSLTSKLDVNELSRASFFYNFTNYCLLAGTIYVICLVLASFNLERVKKRTMVSSIKLGEYNRSLFLANLVFAIVLWLFYVILSFILVGNIMFTMHGLIYIINSFIFMVCALALSFLIGNMLTNKNAINGIVNVIALGSSFLCGAFVPMEWLPDFVIKIAHILPSYWYIKTNELVKSLEVINLTSLKPVIFNMIMILVFSMIFILGTYVVSAKRRKKD